MKKTKHTPGPWVAYGLDSRSPYVCADAGKRWDNPEICNLFNDVTPVDSVSGRWLEPLPNAAANARLIAAAPELFDALNKLLSRAEYHLDRSATHDGLMNVDAIVDARAVLAKVKGE